MRTDLPGRRAWAVLTALPLVIPSYIGAYLFVSALGPQGLAAGRARRRWASTPAVDLRLRRRLARADAVHLPARAAAGARGAARLDPQLEEAARGMGRSRLGVFRTVVLPQLVPAIGAGALLVALYVLSDFGAVSILRFDSFTRVIYRPTARASTARAASLLGACWCVLTLVAALARGARAPPAAATTASGPAPRGREPRGARAAGAGRRSRFCGAVALWRWCSRSACSSTGRTRSVAGEVDWGGSLRRPSALAARRRPGRAASPRSARCRSRCWRRAIRGAGARWSNALSYAGYALPGIVVALALVFFGTRAAPPLYQTLAMLVLALVVLFLPLGDRRDARLAAADPPAPRGGGAQPRARPVRRSCARSPRRWPPAAWSPAPRSCS